MAQAVHRLTAHPALDVLALVVLTLLVWGLYPFSRGVRFFGDDINFLFEAWKNSSEPLVAQLFTKYPRDGFTRVLAFWPCPRHPDAEASRGPPAVLGRLARQRAGGRLRGQGHPAWLSTRPLRGRRPHGHGHVGLPHRVVVYGPHLLGIALFFLGTAMLLQSVEPGHGSARAVAGALLLLWSFFTVEYTYPAVPLVPILIWLHARSTRNARRWGLVARACWRPFLALSLAFAPAVAVLMLDLYRPGSRAAPLLIPSIPSCAVPPFFPFPQWFWHFGSHVAHNFWPVGWASAVALVRQLPADVHSAPVGDRRRLRDGPRALAVPTSRGPEHRRRPAGVGSQVAFAGVALGAMTMANAAAVNLGSDYFLRSTSCRAAGRRSPWRCSWACSPAIAVPGRSPASSSPSSCSSGSGGMSGRDTCSRTP